MNNDILKFCLEKGLLIDQSALDLFSDIEDVESIKLIIEKFKEKYHIRFFTKKSFEKDKSFLEEIISNFSKENQKSFELLQSRLGLNFEIKEESISESNNEGFFPEGNVLVNEMPFSLGKKLCVKDFVTYFKKRFNSMSSLLQQHSELDNLISIDKVVDSRESFSLIGLVISKRVTKNKNILLEVEDLTGKIRVLINSNKKEIFEKAEDICLDSIMGFRVSGNREILFANDIIFPESLLDERKKSPVEGKALFIGDIHYGSKRFLEKDFLNFIDF